MLAHTRHIHSLIQEIKAVQCNSASLSRDHLKVPDLMINISYPIDDNISDITSEIKEEMDELDASVICSDNISDIKAFTKSSDLTKHKKICTSLEKPYKCTECHMAFSESGKQRRHMRIHTKEKPYKCTECHMTFSQSCGLTTHMKIHTKEKSFKCTECNKAFCQSGHLTTHMRIHTKENPYKCTECNMAFSQSVNLTMS